MSSEPQEHCYVCGEAGVSHRPLARRRLSNLWRCPRCGLGYQNPQPTDEQLRSTYTQQYFENWAQTEEARQLVRRMKRATFASHLDRVEGHCRLGRLLDVGCAQGYFVELALERGWDAYGIDVNPDIRQLATEQVKSRLQVGDLTTTDYPDRHFHVVTMCDLIEHHREPLALLRATWRVLVPGGLLLITSPNLSSLSARILRSHWMHFVPDHLWYFSRKSMLMLTTQAGYGRIAVCAAKKYVTAEYVARILDYVNENALLWGVRMAQRVIPSSLWHRRIRLVGGEMLYIGCKAGGCPESEAIRAQPNSDYT